MDRHSRQTRLLEVGEAGQARLAGAGALVVADGLEGEVQARYLAGAGVGTLHVLRDGPARAAAEVDASVRVVRGEKLRAASPPPPELGIRDGAARDVAAGAWRALDDLKALLGLYDRSVR